MPAKAKIHSSGDNAWYFDAAAADRAAAFWQYLPHVKGFLAGSSFRLLPWQRTNMIDPIFGRLRVSDGLRVTRTAWFEMGAKQGKSPIGSGLGLQGLFADREPGAEVYSVAGSKGQAGIVFNVAADMVEKSPRLSELAKVYRSKIAHHGVIEVVKGPAKGSLYKVISADVGLNDGINASRVVFDEPHRQPNRELWDLMQKSGAARSQPLLIGLTTAGVEDPDGLAWQEHGYALQVQEGIIDDPTYHAYVCYNPRTITDPVTGEQVETPWDDEATWRRANPGLGTREEVKNGDAILPIEDFRAVVPKLRTSPTELLTFKRLRLGMWFPAGALSRAKLVDIATWDAAAGFDITPKLRDRHAPGFVMVDLSSSQDVAAAGMLIRNEYEECREAYCLSRGADEPCYTFLMKAWLPEETIAGGRSWSKSHQDLLRKWAQDGYLESVPGAVIADKPIVKGILKWQKRFDIQEIAVDPWQSRSLRVDLEDEGFTVWELNQGMAGMATPTDRALGLIGDRRIHHMGNPFLRWMADNAVGTTDPNGNKRPVKNKSSGRIDGFVALIGSVAVMLRGEEADEYVSEYAVR